MLLFVLIKIYTAPALSLSITSLALASIGAPSAKGSPDNEIDKLNESDTLAFDAFK